MDARRTTGRAMRRVLLPSLLSALCLSAAHAMAARSHAVPLPKPKPGIGTRVLDAPLPRPKPGPSGRGRGEAAKQEGEAAEKEPIRLSAIPPYVEPHRTPARPPAELRSDACLEALRAEGVEAVRAASPSEKDWCRIEDAVSLVSVTGPGGRVELPAKPILDCKFATALGRWLNGIVAPVGAKALGSEIQAVETGPGYVCRNMNGAAQAKRSAHAIGNAIDVVGFRFRNGKRVLIESFDAAKGDERLFLSALRTSACGYFLTVLGPGSDAAHGNHLHVDIAQPGRSANYRICQ